MLPLLLFHYNVMQAAELGHAESQYTVATLALESDAPAQSSSADADAAKW